MSEYAATLEWKRPPGSAFLDGKYSRAHRWELDGITIPGSSSPHIVPLPFSASDAIDPEEAFVASLSSCHLLWFLSIAAARGFVVDSYRDRAVGTLGRNAEGKMAMLTVILRPVVRFSGPDRPSDNVLAAMHHEAHEKCYIANSVSTKVVCEPGTGE